MALDSDGDNLADTWEGQQIAEWNSVYPNAQIPRDITAFGINANGKYPL